ncbi:hypothetical protein HmCmsJML225_04566 [Escherichia coli]|nr:hypothetical protein HmCmsJML115_02409 [Escherichia coli]GDD53454.1 hypothetical protein HmCmsJML225_04566 [Escherichia coli]
MDITNTLIIFRDTFIPYNIFYEICFAKNFITNSFKLI